MREKREMKRLMLVESVHMVHTSYVVEDADFNPREADFSKLRPPLVEVNKAPFVSQREVGEEEFVAILDRARPEFSSFSPEEKEQFVNKLEAASSQAQD